MLKPSFKISPALTLASGIFILTALYLGSSSALDHYLFVDSKNSPTENLLRLGGWQMLLFGRIAEVFAIWWVFFFGASIGSFLNVVVWRMPRGKTIIWKGSHCPGCETDIRFRDNIPIAGWWLLRGQCRGCQMEISSRYPIVELISGLLFLALFFLSTQTNGFCYPQEDWSHVGWHYWLWNRFFCQSIVLPMWQSFLLSVFISIWWIRIDEKRVPWMLFAAAGAFGIIFPLVATLIEPWLVSKRILINRENSGFVFFPELMQFYLSRVYDSVLFPYFGKLVGFPVLISGIGMVLGTVAYYMQEKVAGVLQVGSRERSEADDVWWENAICYGLVGIYGGILVLPFFLLHVLLFSIWHMVLPTGSGARKPVRSILYPFVFLIAMVFWRLTYSVYQSIVS